ncbi:MAG: hypothetical protein JKX97_03905 [Candidatus Lindowbacteria bacterium]|nr:hypothetical protein [Candidatus Lindowbacteria bacterium]
MISKKKFAVELAANTVRCVTRTNASVSYATGTDFRTVTRSLGFTDNDELIIVVSELSGTTSVIIDSPEAEVTDFAEFIPISLREVTVEKLALNDEQTLVLAATNLSLSSRFEQYGIDETFRPDPSLCTLPAASLIALAESLSDNNSITYIEEQQAIDISTHENGNSNYKIQSLHSPLPVIPSTSITGPNAKAQLIESDSKSILNPEGLDPEYALACGALLWAENRRSQMHSVEPDSRRQLRKSVTKSKRRDKLIQRATVAALVVSLLSGIFGKVALSSAQQGLTDAQAAATVLDDELKTWVNNNQDSLESIIIDPAPKIDLVLSAFNRTEIDCKITGIRIENIDASYVGLNNNLSQKIRITIEGKIDSLSDLDDVKKALSNENLEMTFEAQQDPTNPDLAIIFRASIQV